MAAPETRLARVGEALLWLLPVVLLWRLLAGETFAASDLVVLHRPARSILVWLWSQGELLAEWDPLSSWGRRFAGNPHHAVLHPLTWLFAVVPFESAFRLQVVLPLLGGAAAMALLLRTLGLGRTAVAFGAASWGFGGVMLSLADLLPMLLAIAPAPALAALALRLVRRPSRRLLAGVAVAWALSIAGGEPVAIAMAAGLALVAVLAEPGGGMSAGSRAPSLLALAAAFALGTGLALAVVLPGIETARDSLRAGGLGLAGASRSLPPLRLLELVFPRLLGDPFGAGPYWGRALYPAAQDALLAGLYPGLLVSALALDGCWRGRRQRVWALAAATAALVALGAHTPVWALLRALPGLGGVRFPEKAFVVVAFALVVLAADRLDALLARPARAPLARGLLLATALAAITLALGVSRLDLEPAAAGALRRDAVIAVGVAIAGWAALTRAAAARAAAARGAARGRGAAALVCLVAAFDLALAGRPLLPTARPERLDPVPPALASIAGDDSFRVFPRSIWIHDTATLDIERRAPLPSRWGIATAFEGDADLTAPRWSLHATRLFFDLAERSADAAQATLRRRGVDAALLRSPGGGEVLLPLEGRRDDIRCVGWALRYAGDEAWRHAAAALGERLADTALLAGGGPEGELAPCAVRVRASRPGRLELDATAAGPGPSLLAINQTWQPGWQAWIDGEAVEILRADVDLMAVELPPGRHALRLVYRDRALRVGLVLSLLAGVVVAGLGMTGGVRSRA